jgi:PAS domain S-box-containing protein
MKKTSSLIFWICLCLTLVIALACIVGWHTGNNFLIMVFDEQIQMKYNSALGLLFGCSALLVFRYGQGNKNWLRIARILSALVLALGLVTLSEYIFGYDAKLDEWFFKDTLVSSDNTYAGRMSVLASVIFVLLGSGLLLLNRPKLVLFQFYMLSTITIIALLMVIGFNFIDDIPPYIRMAIHLALAFIGLSIAIWYAQPSLHPLIGFQRKLNTTFIAALLLLIVITGVLYYFSNKRVENSRWIRHTSKVMTKSGELQSVLNSLKYKNDATGNQKTDGSSDTLWSTLQSHIYETHQLTADNSLQKSRMDSLLQLVGANTAANLRDISEILNRFQQEENRLLLIRETKNEAGILSSKHIALLLVSTVLVLVTGLFFITRYSNRIRIKSESKFKALLETAPDAMIIANEKGVIQLINLQTEKIFGYKRDELIGQPVEMLIPDSFRSRHQHHRETFMKTPHARPMGEGLQLYAKRKDGSELPVEISLSPIQTDGQQWVSAAIRNITERKKIEEKVLYLARLIEATSEAVFSLDQNLTIKSWNKAAEVLFGYTKEEVIGKPADEITRPQLKEEEQLHIQQQLASVGSWQGEMGFLKKSGALMFLSTSTALTQNVKGELDGYVTVCRDFSERKKLEDELRLMNEELEAFSYSISHDLRAPLRAVTGFTNILEMEYSSQLDDEAKRITHIIKSNTEKMGQLIDDLLAFAHLNKKELEKKDVDTLHLVNDVILAIEQTQDKKILHWNIESLPHVAADQNMLRQVWVNLLSNAVKYSRNNPEPRIHVGFVAEESHILFSVQDNGVGFDEKHADKLFKVFQRLHSDDQFEGTGVGLAIVERIITRHGGRVWAHSKKGEGASFYFTIPNK